jgi:Kef-type K+ transport system membrane component KefB
MPITPAELDAFRRLRTEDLLLPVLVQLAVLILVSRAVAMLFRRLGQPTVVGEVAAGLLLGPSVFGWLFPDLWQALFHPAFEGVPRELSNIALGRIFAIISQLGLIFLLFLVGLEFDFSHLKMHGRGALAISATGVAVPFILGLAIAPLLLPRVEPHPDSGKPVPALGFMLFLGVALAITALPVLARMMLEWNITRTRIGTVTISAAAVDDATGWVLLGSVAAIVRNEFEPLGALKTIGLSVGFAALMVFAVRPFLIRWARAALKRGNGELGLTDLTLLLVALLLCSIATNLIGIFDVFGAFLLGAVLSSEAEFRSAVARRLRDLVTAFFLPVFFTYTGLRTDVRSVGSAEMWLLAGLVLAAAVVGKLGGCGLAARAAGFPAREAALVGAMMSTRGLMELVVINVGYELRVVPRSVYCMLVLMALVTTVMTTPLVRRLARGTELEEPIRKSGFFTETDTPPSANPTGQNRARHV